MRTSWILARAVIEAAEMLGVSHTALRERAGLASDKDDPYAWLPGERLDSLLCAAIELSGRADFGLHWAVNSPMHKLEMLPLLISHTPVLRDGIAAAERVQPLLFDPPLFAFVTQGREAVVQVTIESATSKPAARVLRDLAMASVRRLLNQYEVGPVRASFEHDDGGYGAEYTRIFGQVQFAQPSSELHFDSAALERTHANHNLELRNVLWREVEQLRMRMGASATHRERVTALVRATLSKPGHMPQMSDIAEALELSERSLRRRLQEEGASFSLILQQCLAERAERLLQLPNARLKQVAHELGFDTVSGFYRAFRRWTGRAPRESAPLG